MSFVKLDTKILDSTLWMSRPQREMFITALLLAEPRQFNYPQMQLKVREIVQTGFAVPPGWYGFVEAAGSGIARRALLDVTEGLDALEALGDPDPESRSADYEGRRLIRVDGGYLILNFMRYRDIDHGAAQRMRALRQRRKTEFIDNNDLLSAVTENNRNATENCYGGRGRGRVQEEKDFDRKTAFGEFWKLYPKKVGKLKAEVEWDKLGVDRETSAAILVGLGNWKTSDAWKRGYVVDPERFLKNRRWEDEVPAAPVPSTAQLPADRMGTLGRNEID